MKNFINDIDVSKLKGKKLDIFSNPIENNETYSTEYTIMNATKENGSIFLTLLAPVQDTTFAPVMDRDEILALCDMDPKFVDWYLRTQLSFPESLLHWSTLQIKNPQMLNQGKDFVVLDNDDPNMTSSILFRRDRTDNSSEYREDQDPFMWVYTSENGKDSKFMPVRTIQDIRFAKGILPLRQAFAECMSEENRAIYEQEFRNYCLETIKERTISFLAKETRKKQKLLKELENVEELINGYTANVIEIDKSLNGVGRKRISETKNHHSKFAPTSAGVKSRKPIEDDFELTL